MLKSISTIVKTIILCSLLILTIPSTAFAAWNDISSSVTISQTDRAIDRVKRSLFSYVTIENTSSQEITGPLRLVIQDSTIVVTDASGTTDSSSPYITITETSIPANSKITYKVNFVMDRKALSFTPKLEQDVTVGEFTPPVFRGFEFVELRGRDGHQGYFPVYGKPTIGNGVVEVKIAGDVKDLSVSVETASETKIFKFNPDNIDPENGYTRYFVDVTVPKEDFSLDILITAPDEKITNEKTNTSPSKNFSISIAKSNHIFSHGKNSLSVIVTNKGDDANFEAIVTDSEGIIQGKGYFPQTFTIKKDGKAYITIPINVVKNSDINNLSFTINVSNIGANTSEIITYDVLVDSDEEPLAMSSKSYKWIATPGSCEPISINDSTIKIVIIGTSSIIIENIDTSTISLFGGQKPDKTEAIDIVSTSDSCSSSVPDGRTDLVLTFDWQKIVTDMYPEQFDPQAKDFGFYLHYQLNNRYSRGFDVNILMDE